MRNPSKIKNKVKRSEVFLRYKEQKKKLKKKLRTLKAEEVEKLGEAAPPKQIPRTIENTRANDKTFVKEDDYEILGDEKDDEFASYFSNEKKPKILITTRPNCSKNLYTVIGDLMQMIPQAFYYPRGNYEVKELVKYASNRNFTHLIILGEKQKQCNGLLISHLPIGPTAYFKLSSFTSGAKIPGHGQPTNHIPEIILNNFLTRLGRRVGRFLGSLFPHEAQLEGRQVVTFHNQRDFIFVRHHRYIYRQQQVAESTATATSSSSSSSKNSSSKQKQSSKDKEEPAIRARLQELGPRFTLKLQYLQEGVFDTQFGEYEWMRKPGLIEGSKKKFFL